MPSAILEIRGEGSSAARMFAELASASRTNAASVLGDWQRVAREIAGIQRGIASNSDRAESQRVRANRRATEQIAANERRASDAAARGSAYRASAARRETDDGEKSADRLARARERAEARATNASIRASNTRRSLDRQREREEAAGQARRERAVGRVVGGLSRAGSIAGGTLSEIMGNVMDARQRRAASGRELGLALYQTGADRGEVAARQAEVARFAARTGISVADVAGAANAAQTEFNSLRGGTAAERAASFGNLLQTIELGRNTGNDPAQFARLQGMLSQSGFSAAQQRQMLLFTAGASQAGAVEAGSLTREGMASTMARMAQAQARLGPNATTAQRQDAAAAAFREHVATLQVARGFGTSVTQAGNVTSALDRALQNTAVQDRMLTNLRTRRAATTDARERGRIDALIGDVFEADPSRTGGHMRLRTGTGPMQLAAAFADTMGNDPTLFSNLFGGTGHGNAQGLQANWRRLMGVMLSSDAEGRTGASRVKALMGPGIALTEADVARGQGIFQNDLMSEHTRRAEQRDTALTDNTSAIVRLADTIDQFRAEHPMAAIAAQQAGGDAAVAALAAGNATSGTAGLRFNALSAAQQQAADPLRAQATREINNQSFLRRLFRPGNAIEWIDQRTNELRSQASRMAPKSTVTIDPASVAAIGAAVASRPLTTQPAPHAAAQTAGEHAGAGNRAPQR